ncbi:helix-turn-helix transcriptional regulator [Methylobacterium phyllosphaerae]
MDILLPSLVDLSRHQVIGAGEAARLANMSLDHWRRLYRAGRVPKPLKIGERKVGWRQGDLLDWLAEQATKALHQ